MDKEIIINGVDVSKCEYRDWRNFCCCNNSKENEGEERVTGRGGCKYNPNCHYKQLARKEQEFRNICKAFDIEYLIDKETGSLIARCNKLDKKEQECEELKQWRKGAENLFKAQIDNPDKIINRYKQALDEIRQYRVCEINDEDEEETDTILRIIDGVQNG